MINGLDRTLIPLHNFKFWPFSQWLNLSLLNWEPWILVGQSMVLISPKTNGQEPLHDFIIQRFSPLFTSNIPICEFWRILTTNQCETSPRSNGLKWFSYSWVNLDSLSYPTFKNYSFEGFLLLNPLYMLFLWTLNSSKGFLQHLFDFWLCALLATDLYIVLWENPSYFSKVFSKSKTSHMHSLCLICTH